MIRHFKVGSVIKTENNEGIQNRYLVLGESNNTLKVKNLKNRTCVIEKIKISSLNSYEVVDMAKMYSKNNNNYYRVSIVEGLTMTVCENNKGVLGVSLNDNANVSLRESYISAKHNLLEADEADNEDIEEDEEDAPSEEAEAEAVTAEIEKINKEEDQELTKYEAFAEEALKSVDDPKEREWLNNQINPYSDFDKLNENGHKLKKGEKSISEFIYAENGFINGIVSSKLSEFSKYIGKEEVIDKVRDGIINFFDKHKPKRICCTLKLVKTIARYELRGVITTSKTKNPTVSLDNEITDGEGNSSSFADTVVDEKTASPEDAYLRTTTEKFLKNQIKRADEYHDNDYLYYIGWLLESTGIKDFGILKAVRGISPAGASSSKRQSLYGRKSLIAYLGFNKHDDGRRVDDFLRRNHDKLETEASKYFGKEDPELMKELYRVIDTFTSWVENTDDSLDESCVNRSLVEDNIISNEAFMDLSNIKDDVINFKEDLDYSFNKLFSSYGIEYNDDTLSLNFDDDGMYHIVATTPKGDFKVNIPLNDLIKDLTSNRTNGVIKKLVQSAIKFLEEKGYALDVEKAYGKSYGEVNAEHNLRLYPIKEKIPEPERREILSNIISYGYEENGGFYRKK